METKKATRSGGNPNAAAWDPEKMELHRIVNWLLALEERRALVSRPEEHGVLHKVNLPGFWEKDAAAWDPEKMELHRIVNRLLALGERRAIARPVEHAVPQKVKLPGFWEKDAATWGLPGQSWRTTTWSTHR